MVEGAETNKLEQLRELVQIACFAADAEVIGFQGTGAEKTRLGITAALDHLEQLGLISISPDFDKLTREWPGLPIQRQERRL